MVFVKRNVTMKNVSLMEMIVFILVRNNVIKIVIKTYLEMEYVIRNVSIFNVIEIKVIVLIDVVSIVLINN